MKRLMMLAATTIVGFSLGCGPSYDESKSGEVKTEEDLGAEIEQAVESGEIDAATYGKE